ncbi:MAG: bifunctional nicotinamidase/pyrazinamidase [Spirochaetes bacterium]|nr:bifunctional nicotinamidase/pyrazinamidase [Spirochaetota bacterium]MBU1079028.1 bifunctional nicotinamidase/pyrazinamidase [Spirochaetota bacterium]
MLIDTRTAAFIAVDVQNDFCSGGALAVPDGDAVVRIVNGLAESFELCVATQDWHPEGHASFASAHPGARPFDPTRADGREATLWPDHCVRGTRGADFHPGLSLEPYRLIVRKGFRPELDSYSAFYENDGSTPTGLDGYLRGLGASTVVLAGLALDYCVYFSALDAARLGYSVFLVRDGCRAVGSPAGSVGRALADLSSRGVAIIDSVEVLR